MKDVFHAYLVDGARFTEGEEYPIIGSCDQIPQKMIPFSQIKYTKDFNQAVHFYETDDKIECFANNPHRYLQRLKKFKAVITPDFSVYRDMPLVVQRHQTYLNRAFGFWLQKNGVPIIPNVRYGDERTYSFCFEGIPQNSVISIGTHGTGRAHYEAFCTETKSERNNRLSRYSSDHAICCTRPLILVFDSLSDLAMVSAIFLISANVRGLWSFLTLLESSRYTTSSI